MGSSLFGLEAELAVSAIFGGRSIPVEHVAGAFAQVARRNLVHLRGGHSRCFLANGGLFYIDHGCHPEYATAECTTPSEAVCHLLAGQRMVARLAALVRGEIGAEQVLVCRTNVDYHRGTTWGCHESYLGRRPVAAYESWLLPHLASRIPYTGSGGLDPLSPGIRLSVSPRVAHIEKAVSSDSTAGRGIFHTRDEPLCNGYSRVHILAGDNACSQRASWLKVGTTALVVAFADSAVPAACPIRLSEPVAAMQRFARDPRHRARVELRRGSVAWMTAIDIQRQLLAMIEPHAGSSRLPDWASAVCAAWKDALDLIESPAIHESHAFDWPLKFGLFRREMARSGFTEQAIMAWSDALEHLSPPPRPDGRRPLCIDRARIAAMQGDGVLSGAAIDEAARMLGEHGLSWDGLDGFNALRRELCTIDVRFGELGEGIFESLDRRDMIPDHRIVTEAQIRSADANAPTGSRAGVRARWVEKLDGQRDRYACDWDGIFGESVRLDLSDPFATTGKWDNARET